MADLNTEIWLPELLEAFVPDDSFLNEARDMSAFVEHDKINLAEAGALPDVLVNNTTYPIPTTQRTDTPIAIELDHMSTKSTLVRRLETMELAYDKLSSVVWGHKEALRQKVLELAAQEYAPAGHSKQTPVVGSSGAVEGGVKKLTFEDLLELDTAFDNAEVPQNGRVLVLCATHKKHLRQQDIKTYKEVFERKLFGSFKVYSLADDRVPRYHRATGVKLAAGGGTAATKTLCSIAFQKNEVMRAVGTAEMFVKRKDPDEQGDKLNFLMRFKAMPIRNKGIGAVYSAA